MKTNGVMSQSAFMAHDETAVQHKPQCVPAGSRNGAEDTWTGSPSATIELRGPHAGKKKKRQERLERKFGVQKVPDCMLIALSVKYIVGMPFFHWQTFLKI